jgi:hypothetical protein
MSLRRPLAALAALATTGAIALPASGASAQVAPIVFTPPLFVCQTYVSQISYALLTGNALLANLISQQFIYSHCGGAAI